MTECPICYTEMNSVPIFLHDSVHAVCSGCNDTMRSLVIKSCPLCREPINMDIEACFYNSIADAQLKSFGFSREFIEYIRPTRLPFTYKAGTRYGVEFIREMKLIAAAWPNTI